MALSAFLQSRRGPTRRTSKAAVMVFPWAEIECGADRRTPVVFVFLQGILGFVKRALTHSGKALLHSVAPNKDRNAAGRVGGSFTVFVSATALSSSHLFDLFLASTFAPNDNRRSARPPP